MQQSSIFKYKPSQNIFNEISNKLNNLPNDNQILNNSDYLNFVNVDIEAFNYKEFFLQLFADSMKYFIESFQEFNQKEFEQEFYAMVQNSGKDDFYKLINVDSIKSFNDKRYTVNLDNLDEIMQVIDNMAYQYGIYNIDEKDCKLGYAVPLDELIKRKQRVALSESLAQYFFELTNYYFNFKLYQNAYNDIKGQHDDFLANKGYYNYINCVTQQIKSTNLAA